ncbi:hypothetical protein BDA96_07G068700 [Sorghum bicolor]|uniref:Cupin type-1 domain-containing protein n=1 Tax=Sorghum bicolor TaxID=4558 RepID=A0A921QIZ5_SORBI|nr:hypothetical protein BDA96_07G068700 [Sorghum bicolor]
MVPGAAGKERAATNNNTTGGGPSSIIKQPNFSNPGDDIMEGHSSDVTEPNEEAGTVLLQNPGNAEDTLEEDPAVQQPNDVNTEQQTIEEQAVVENQQDIVVNQQHLPEEQAGIVREQNIQNAIEENVLEDHAVFADIFNFPLNNELVDLGQIEDIMEDPAGVENKQNIINNQQHIPDQQAGIVQQQNPAENAIEVAEDDPTASGVRQDCPLRSTWHVRCLLTKCVHDKPAVAIAALSSQNPGAITIANAVFGSKPPISDDVLAKAFQVQKGTIDSLQAQFWENNHN